MCSLCIVGGNVCERTGMFDMFDCLSGCILSSVNPPNWKLVEMLHLLRSADLSA